MVLKSLLKGQNEIKELQTWSADRFVLFDLIIYAPVNSFSVMWGRVFLG